MSLTLDRHSPAHPPAAGRVGSRAEVVSPPSPNRLTVATPRRRREIVAVIDPVWAPPDPDVTAGVRPPVAVVHAVAERLTRFLQPGELVASTAEGRLTLRLRHEDRAARPVRLQEMAYHAVEAFDALTDHGGVFDLGVGWARISRKQDPRAAEMHAAAAAAESVNERDLQPRSNGAHVRRRHPAVNLWTASRQVLLATVGSVVLPFVALVGLYAVGLDVSSVVYWALVAALGLTAATIWAECSHAVDPELPPSEPSSPAPRATAVIAAYLPNEADTILETVDSFLAQDYSGGLQVVLAYNTPVPLDVEDDLAALAHEHADLTVLKVPDSTSKAQNVNAALRVAEGEFVGIFDADHHPMAGAFDRAWCWIADGADVVQGHCVIRNGADSAMGKLVAVEFEQIYAVSHPGRTRLFGFGIFGGSNGYWRASALERIRLRGSFLTEDIEASMRVLDAGGRIVNDPGLVSRELAPETPKALWNQRMRWAQGWFQVSCRHLWPILRSPALTLRQRIGIVYLLGWREAYPWIALTAWPLIGFYVWRDGGLDLSSPIFLLLTLFTTVSGPLQTVAAWRLAAPELRRHPSWFVGSAVANVLFYTELKNIVNRVAQLKQLRGEHRWVVTPRSANSSGAVADDPTATEPVHEEVAA
ncbi:MULTISPECIES: glycosyltransferase [unclassified Nocardioides]|uniref:glycosyltransferase n=1 Tax=unclassified Nocardioides TaxID=2615069 RepID=UPI0009EFD268|nr:MULTISPECIES: glycosyltransferase family 2 protein [unclassified Nocardioides]GAW51046.1 Response regulator receiver protein [Nocardioides sp. PD653-B2]GAW54001.1 Response regulator receiver protein [Nocardioides sp. PD653]